MTWRSLNLIPREIQSSESHMVLREWLQAIPGLSLWVQPRSEPNESYWVIEFDGAELAQQLGLQITRELDRPASLGVLAYPIETRVCEAGIEAISAIIGWKPQNEIQLDADSGSVEQDIGAGLIALAIVRRFGGWFLYENPVGKPDNDEQGESIPGVSRKLSYLEEEELVEGGLGDEAFHTWWVAHEKFSLLYGQPS